MQFGTGYFNPMDQGYESHDHNHSHIESKKSTGDVGVGIGDLGMSMGLGPIRNVQDIQAKLRPGTKKLEFVFFGQGKGSAQGHTPGSYGKKQRQALQEVGKANKVDFTTHSTVGIYGLSGMDRGGSFSKQRRNESYQELKRAVEFAAEVGKGGPVVVHTGEFERPVSEATWNTEEGKYQDQFKMFSDEEKTATYKVVDRRSGGLVQEARKNRNVTRPDWLEYDKVKSPELWEKHGGKAYIYTDPKTAKQIEVKPGEYIDYWGKKMNRAERVPWFDKKDQKFRVKEYGWEEMEDEAARLTKEAKREWQSWKKGEIEIEEFRKGKWARFEEIDDIDKIRVRPEEASIIASLETSAANARGFALMYIGDFEEEVDTLTKLREARKFYQKLQDATSDEEKWHLKKQIPGRYDQFLPPDTKFPVEIIDKQIMQLETSIKRAQETASGQLAQAQESLETIKHIESAENYALREAADAYAESAIFAWRQTKQLKEKGEFKKDVAVALENLFPEHYGSHPDELMDLVDKSRKSMVRMLKEKYKMSKEEAGDLAKKHITTTFDTGHLNMWRKYWKPNPKLTVKENDDAFDDWQLAKVKEMVKRDMIGHVHIDDNYGYQDDHLAPGEGNTPVKEMIKILKENGYKGELIVEPGADYYNDASGFSSVMKTWRDFGIPVYGAGSGLAGAGRTWQSVGYGHFGRNQPPYFVINPYFPSEEWQSWTGVSLD
tara:strand:- start:32074 stop:34224 length:2151 start_codon:yes stop_codon:yes gene_type:complete